MRLGSRDWSEFFAEHRLDRGRRGERLVHGLAACLVDAGAGAARVEQVRRELARGGVETSPDDAGELPVVAVLAAATPHAEALVREVSRGGRRRVLVLAVQSVPAANTWRLLHAFSTDVLPWAPGRAEDVVARLRRWTETDQLLDSPEVAERLVGSSPAWLATLRRVVEVARFTTSPVLLVGESGTGKELVARLVHDLDRRHDKGRLVVVDCTTVVSTLSGSEFFGHERGAFTGAVAVRQGAFELADGGTLFLDEVGELPLQMQAELLRVVQEHTFKRVGSNVWQKTAFRLVCATNRDLVQEQAAGRFRRDFYYRIAAASIRLPPLRDRLEDAVPLFRYFLGQLLPGKPPEIEPVVRALLLDRDYPGNIRDLRQLAWRVSNRHVGTGPITAGDVPEDDRPAPEPAALRGTPIDELAQAVRSAVRQGTTLRELRESVVDLAAHAALDEAGGNVRRAAARLGITERALQLRRAAWRSVPAPRAPQAPLDAAPGA